MNEAAPQLQLYLFDFYFTSGDAENYGVARVFAENREEAKQIYSSIFEYGEDGDNLISIRLPPNVELIGLGGNRE